MEVGEQERVTNDINLIQLTKEQLEAFIKQHQAEEYWVGPNDFKWSAKEITTIGASVCFVPILFNPNKAEVGLGHFPYTYVEEEIKKHPDLKEDYDDYIEQIRAKVQGGKGWIMFLFGGSAKPKKGNDPNEVKEELKKMQRNKEALMETFSSMGAKCVDLTFSEPYKCIEGIIVNPQKRTISYLYGKATKEL